MKTELKPCPHCRGKAEYRFRNTYPTEHFVICLKCGARTADMKTERGADNRWNRRAK